jgi:hypothetical protein
MKRFLTRLAMFTAFFLLFDKLFIIVRNTSPTREVDRRLERVLEGQIRADVLVFGSSRGAQCVIAQRFADSGGPSAYNLSYPGSDITFHEYLLRQTLETKGNQKPKTVILVVDDSDELMVSNTLEFRLDRLYPLVRYKDVRDEMVRRGKMKPIISELVVLSQLNQSNFKLRKRQPSQNYNILPCGSMPIFRQKATFDREYNSNINTYSPVDELAYKLQAFNSFTDLCRKNDIRLIIAVPPNFRKVTTGFIPRLEQLLNGYGTVFIYDENKPEYTDPDYFFDKAHLNEEGAKIYTDELVQFHNQLAPN